MKSKSICIIEDDDTIRETVSDFLELEGHSVKSFSNGLDAFNHLEGTTIHPDLILVDNFMPKMSGVEFVQRAATSSFASKRIVILSASHNSFDGLNVTCIRKPYELDQLLAMVDSV